MAASSQLSPPGVLLHSMIQLKMRAGAAAVEVLETGNPVVVISHQS